MIRNEDYKTLKKVPKLGEKKAQLIILDLKSKIKNLNLEEVSSDSSYYDMEEDIMFALEGLGYSKKEIEKIFERVNLKMYDSIEEAIKSILKNMKDN